MKMNLSGTRTFLLNRINSHSWQIYPKMRIAQKITQHTLRATAIQCMNDAGFDIRHINDAHEQSQE